MTLSHSDLSALVWIRDNWHVRAAWLPASAKPKDCTHLSLSGCGSYRRFTAAQIRRLFPLLVPGHAQNRFFDVTPEGLALLKEAGL